jgi:hypothetical protein
MDGPNVNWKFFRLLKEQETTEHIMDLGSCGLHVIHGPVGYGISSVKWEILGFLSGIYYLRNDTPARRGDFVSLTESE